MTMRIRNHIGYWLRDLTDERYCAPQEVVGNLPPDVRTKLADYLDAGITDRFLTQFGFSWCRFFCGVAGTQMGSRELTDGFWIWPQGLSHYVREHGILLPDQFIAHVLAQEGPPVSSEDFSGFLGPPSMALWVEWCASHRSPAFLRSLRRARAEAEAQAEAEAEARAEVAAREHIEKAVPESIGSCGLGEDRCLWAGCEERVPSGMRVCARHVHGNKQKTISDACYKIRPAFLANFRWDERD